jgi:H+/Cl- antiporter ClcA
MTREEGANKRELYFLLTGIVLGSVMGVFGSLFSTWLYDTQKTQWWFSGAIVFSAIYFFVFLIIMMYLVIKLGKQIRSKT